MSQRIHSLLPGWRYMLWSDADNEKLVIRQFPQFLDNYRRISRGVVKADIARCMYLHAYGGFYFDTDYKLLKPINTDLLSRDCVLPISRGSACEDTAFRLGNAVMASAPRHRFWMDFLCNLFSENLGGVSENQIEKVSGPEGLTEFYRAHRHSYDDIWLAPKQLFHPEITRHGFSCTRSNSSIGAHLCWGSWRSKSPLQAMTTIVKRKMTAL